MQNTGISFGVQIPGVVWLTLGITGVLAYKAIKNRDPGLGLMALGGGLNLWQRLNMGYVNDYWRIPGTSIYNNLNDWLIFAGAAIYIYSLWQNRK